MVEQHWPQAAKLEKRCFVFLKSLLFICLFAVPVLAQESSSSLDQKGEASTAPKAVEQLPPSETVLAAEAAIAASDWKNAEEKLSAWVVNHDGDARALFDLGYVADAQNRMDDAAANYRRALAADPKSFEARLSLGLLLARKGLDDDAHEELESATRMSAGAGGAALKARAWRALARMDAKNDPESASDELLEALKISSQTEEDLLLAALLAERTNQLELAESSYKKLLDQDAENVQAKAGLAHLLIARRQFEDAEKLLRSALEQSPDDLALSAQLATVLAAENKAEAIPLLEKLHTAHPEDAAISRMLAEVKAEAGDVAGSDLLYAKLLADDPANASLLVAHGQNLVRESKMQEAFALFAKATKLDPSEGDGWAGLAFTASRTNQPAITIHALTERSKFQPENASTYFLWATAYDALHQKQQAVVYYHHFMDAAQGKYPNQEWQAKQRLQLLEK